MLGGGNGCNGQECSFDIATNQTLRVFNTTTRLVTDALFHCFNQFTAYAGDRGYNSNGVCLPPVTVTHPNGVPELEYFKCHAGGMSVTFGNWARVGLPARDQYDKPYTQVVVDYWTSFARNLNSNPDVEYIHIREYWDTLSQITVSGPWEAVKTSAPAMMELQWNSVMVPFPDAKQCAVLGQSLDALL
ncbi:hypothetical protein LTR08_004662 [Meristemomyces frigidus]|nr:hypothetical protein LTR08_004662 [Meristemomyces frigidus]